MKTFLIKDATIINEGCVEKASLLIENERIKKIYKGDEILPESVDIIDASGKYLLPGVIDDQVHFREPGLTYKGDIYTESRAAVAGGTTSFMEMPNTNPQTTTIEELNKKFEIASTQSLANYSFYLGATNDNLAELKKVDPKSVCGIKIFMGSSTGNMLVDSDKILSAIFAESPILIATHCEDETTIKNNLASFHSKYGDDMPFRYHPLIRNDEACYLSSSKAVELATKYNAKLHVLHLSSAKEIALFRNSIPLSQKRITAEVCVHHLWFDDRDYDTKGSLIKWNPAIKTQLDKESLLAGLLSNNLDVIATDHAPHTMDEKNNGYFKAPSGGPLVQHSLVAMLELSHQQKLSIEKVVEKMCHAPAILYNVVDRGYIREGYFADLVLVDKKQWQVSKENILYKCGWSPFEGNTFNYKVTHTFVNGALVYENGTIINTNAAKSLVFDR